MLCLALGFGSALGAQRSAQPPAELIHFTADGSAGGTPLLPGFRHDSVWSALATDGLGRLHVAVSNHQQPGGNVALFRYDPHRRRMVSLGDLRSISAAAGNWMPGESQYKVHTFLVPDALGRFHFASMDHPPSPFLRGAHLYRLDPTTGVVEDLSRTQPFLMTKSLAVIPNTGQAAERSGVFIEEYGIKGLGLNPRAPDLLYAMTYPEGHLIQQVLSTGAMEVVGRSENVGYVFHVGNEGDAFYGVPAPGGLDLLRYDTSAGSTRVVAAGLPGELLGAVAPTPEGDVVYLLEALTKSVYRLDTRSDEVSFLATVCGSNWWRLFNLSLGPEGEGLFYVSNNNARSTIRAIDVDSGACREVLDVDALLGTRDLCFGGVNAWDRNGNLFAPAWTFGAAQTDLVLLRVSLGTRPRLGAAVIR